MAISYPPARRVDVVDKYQSAIRGPVAVADPYRWMHEHTAERDAWIQAQTQLTSDHLADYRDKEKLAQAILKSHRYQKFTSPRLESDLRWYWTAQTATQEQPVVYRSLKEELPNAGPDGLLDVEAIAELFFDANMLSKDGTKSIDLGTNWSFSPDGKHVGYVITRCGSDRPEVLIYAASSSFNRESPDTKPVDRIPCSQYGAWAWSPDSAGIYYATPLSLVVDAVTERANLVYHALGTTSDQDEVLLTAEFSGEVFEFQSSSDGRYLVLSITIRPERDQKVWIANIENRDRGEPLQWFKVSDDFNGSYQYITDRGQDFYFLTDKGSDRLAVLIVDIQTGTRSFPSLISDSRNLFLRAYHLIDDDHAVAVYSHNVRDELYVLNKNSPPYRLDKDFDGTIVISPTANGFFATFTSYTTPSTIKRFEISETKKHSWTLWRTTVVPELPASEFITEQIWYESKDGTRIPMSVIRSVAAEMDGTAPCLLHAYGAYYASYVPAYYPDFLTFVRSFRGVLAIPNIRGGTEFGKTWAAAGRRENKVNQLDDFIAAKEFLVENKYAAQDRFAVWGLSAGSALVAESIMHAPEGTFAAAVANRGLFDRLQYVHFTPGQYWIEELGDPQTPGEFDWLFPLSPLHQVPLDKSLPPTLVIVAGDDERSQPPLGYKYLATLQAVASRHSGVQLLANSENAGHDSGKSTSLQVSEAKTFLTFIAKSLRLTLVATDET